MFKNEHMNFMIKFHIFVMYANSEENDQKPQNATSDQDMHCLCTEFQSKAEESNITQHPINKEERTHTGFCPFYFSSGESVNSKRICK